MHKECKYIVLALLLSVSHLCWCMGDNSGSSCENAIDMQTGFNDLQIPQAGTYWFTATTYDLPVEVTFIPTVFDADKPLQAFVDFTCNGVYDEDIDKVVHGSSTTLVLPAEMTVNHVIVDGKDAWRLSVKARYREIMAMGGITREVRAYVRVEAPSSGNSSAEPDVQTHDCLTKHIYVQSPDTLDIEANNNDTTFIFPFNQWADDSLQFVWTGQTAPAILWLAKEDCNFEPSKTDPSYKTHYEIPANDSIKLTVSDIEALSKKYDGGVFYAKITSTSDGQFMIKSIPEKSIAGIKLKEEKTVKVRANEDTVYYFSKEWGAMRFHLNTPNRVKAYFGLTPQIDTADANTYFAKYILDFDERNKEQYIELSDAEMTAFKNKQSSNENYIYTRFISPVETKLTVSYWDASDWTNLSYQLRPNDTIEFGTTTQLGDKIYRMRYADWRGYDITVTRNTKTGKSFLMGISKKESAEEMSTFTTSNGKKACIEGSYCEMLTSTLSYTYSSVVVDSWETTKPPKDGFYYWYFNAYKKALKVWFTTAKPPMYAIDGIAKDGGYVKGGGVYKNGESVVLTAIADECYTFVKWSDGETTPERTIEVTGDATYEAEFKLKTTTILVSAGSTNGTVRIEKVE